MFMAGSRAADKKHHFVRCSCAGTGKPGCVKALLERPSRRTTLKCSFWGKPGTIASCLPLRSPRFLQRGTFGTIHSFCYLEISRILFWFLSYVPTHMAKAAALRSDQGAVNPSPEGKTLLPSPLQCRC